jgi:geranylgeranyl pyrophosphate synthase
MADLFAAGGKRLRPALVLLCANLGDYDFETAKHGAMAVEFMHASTLVHDDVIDRSELRRGRPTVFAAHGADAAILVGDYYFAKAYEEAAKTDHAPVVADLAFAVSEVCKGELKARADIRVYHRQAGNYTAHVCQKTGSLMLAACRIGARLGQTDFETAGVYGLRLGEAFQIVDDVLDYTGAAAEIGKPVGHDLLEGTATLPLLLAFDTDSERLDALVTDREPLDEETVSAVVEIVRESGATERALDWARKAAAEAVRYAQRLPAGEARNTLEKLATYVVERKA